MSAAHHVEYSKSSKAKCHGAQPCAGTAIDLGVLRYGQTTFTDYGESVKWRHWGCVTPAILNKLAGLQMERVPGFKSLRLEDQAKIRQAIKNRRVDPADVPPSARTLDSSALDAAAGSSQKKRKADMPPSSSQPGSSQPAMSSSQANGSMSMSQVIEIDDDEDEDNNPAEEARDELYCMLKTNIVGIQYYKGMVGSGEEVRLRREPHNKYDPNAIQVLNIAGAQIGHLPRQVAGKLAPLLDRRAVNVEGVMHEGNLNGFAYSLSMTLKFYGAADKRAQLEPVLIWATPGQRGFPPPAGAPSSSQAVNTTHLIPGAASSSRPSYPSSSQAGGVRRPTAAQAEAARKQQEALARAAELREMLTRLEKVDDEGRRGSLLDTLCSVADILALPLHPSPPGRANGDLKVDLLKHQSQALQWCVEREYPKLPKAEGDKPVQFWLFKKNGPKGYYYNIATKTPQEAPPVLGRGALCADSMGLGKTLTMLALILATKHDVPLDHSNSSLIVVPLSVLSNWESQIKEHCTPGALTYCVYYGAARNTLTPAQLRKCDVVITTYQVVVSEQGALPGAGTGAGTEPSQKKAKTARRKGLFDVEWKRVILDEGHSIRNPKTKMAKAVCALTAQRRWVLSGTPIINSPRDLGSILTFLQICRPLDNEDFFKRLVLRPLKNGDPSGAELLRALMSQICIRRTKEMRDKDGNPLVPLPPVEMIQVPVTLNPEARALYEEIEQLSRNRFEGFMAANGGINVAVQGNVLSMLTRLRQLSLHPGLIPANYLEQLRHANDTDNAAAAAPTTITPKDKIRLQTILAQAVEDSEECPICFGILNEPRITGCAHAFCLACITEVISRDPKCPMDRRPIATNNLVEPAPPTDLTQARAPIDEDDEEPDGIRVGSSDKVNQLVHLLKLTPPTEKSLVFSQFTSFLDKIAETLAEEGIPYVRFDGQMSAKRRQETLEQFSIPISESAAAPAVPEASSARSSRLRSKRSTSSVTEEFKDSKDDSDFAVSDGDDGDDSFLDDDNDDGVWSKGKAKGKGKGKAKASSKGKRKAVPRFSSPPDDLGFVSAGGTPKVMLISLKAGALGLNLTVANNVYLMDPWWQEGIESQAIDRCNRIGQKKPVHVYQLIAEDTVESKVIEIQEKKKLLISQAFSGIKNTETQRQKKEARLQDLIQLFGIRQQAASQNAAASDTDP